MMAGLNQSQLRHHSENVLFLLEPKVPSKKACLRTIRLQLQSSLYHIVLFTEFGRKTNRILLISFARLE